MYSPKNLRNQRLRLYGPSLAMLLFLIPFFSYYTKRVKIEEGYQNDRAFRVLDLIARQFDAEIDGAHNTMVAALRIPGQECNLWPVHEKNCAPHDEVSGIRNYLNAYVPDKYVSEGNRIPVAITDDGPVEEVSLVNRQKPRARSKIAQLIHAHSIAQFQDSRAFIELWHEGDLAGPSEKKTASIRIFLDPEKMLTRALENDRLGLFDTVFVASLQKTGEVLAQESNPQVNVLEVETLLKSGRLHNAIEAATSAKAESTSWLSFATASWTIAIKRGCGN